MPPTLNPNRTASKAARGVAILLALVVAVLAIGWWWIHRSIPPLDGRIRLAGLQRPVRVQFDRFAIPHVFAGSDADAWRAVGYLQARDRLWQMELYRRAASGRLSELLGEATIAVDQRFLTLDLRRAAEREWEATPQPARTAFENHAAGVNAAMSVGFAQLPLEFQLLRVRPEPWTPIDSMGISKLFAWRLGENHTAEALRYALMEELGPRVRGLFPEPPEWAPVVLPDDDRAEGSALKAEWKVERRGQRTKERSHNDIEYPPGLEWLSFDNHALSNGWVVHGSRTATGRPILANDPHLNIEMPSVWWEVHVVSDTLDVAGVTIPGIPFVIIGHNQRVGWGLTNVGTDVQDFFVEKLDASRQRYLVGDRWVPLSVRKYDIRVRGRSTPIPFEVRSTRHGPVLDADQWRDAQPGDAATQPALQETVLALKWDVVIQPGAAAAFDALARATRWTEFLDAVRRFAAPAQNFLYADVDGNIGYAVSGLVPLRNGFDGAVPAPGWPVDADWHGYVDVSELPAVTNPSDGQIVTANNEVSRTLPYALTTDWVAPFRAQRIVELIGQRRDFDVDDMRQIQADVTSRAAGWILDAVHAPEPVKALRAWDRRVDARSVSLLYQGFEEALWRATFADEMPTHLYNRFYRYAGNERFAGLRAIITDPQSPWFDDRTTSGVVEMRDDMVRKAGELAVRILRERLGDASALRWDAVHAIRFSHPLSGGGPVLDWFFSRGPVPVAGDNMTINKTTTNLRRPYAASEAASYRQILDVGDWDRSVAVNTTGQSGHPRSPHYFDQNRLWRQTQHRALPYTRAAVDAATVSRLELTP